MSKNSKKYRHSSLIDVPFTQRTAYFKQENQPDPYRTLPSKSTFKHLLQQNENIPPQNRNNQNQCLKSIQDKLSITKIAQQKNSLKKVNNTCFKEFVKNGINANINETDELEKKIQSIIDKKMKKIVETCVQKHISKFFENQKEFLQNFRFIYQNQVNARIMKIEKGYNDILHTYDNFLIIAQKIKDKSSKGDKYAKRSELQSLVKKSEAERTEVEQKIQKICRQLSSLKKLDSPITMEHDKLKPISLKYNEAQQFGLEELRVVVNTYNENFMQIDQKLQQIYSYFT